jgi:DNA polymerase-1
MRPLVTPAGYAAAMEAVARSRSLVVDLETTGLRPYRGDRLFGVAVACDAEGPIWYFPFRHETGQNLAPEQLPPLLDLIASRDCPARPRELGGHNFIRFDLPMLVREGPRYEGLLADDHIPKWDTIIDALLANENEDSFSLEALSVKYLGADEAEKERRTAVLLERLRQRHPGVRSVKELKGRMVTLPPEAVAPYACGDVKDCRALRAKYVAYLDRSGLTPLAREMYRYARLLAAMERHGLLINRALAERRIPQLVAAQAWVLEEIRGLAGCTFNPNSPQQVCRVLKTADARMDTLRKLEHPLAKLIVTYKHLGKMRRTYYEAILERLDPQNVIHPQLNLTRDPTDGGGTRSGRLSCSNPNVQNLPKRETDPLLAVRELVIPRPGHVLLVQDYERAEMWMAAHYSRDQSLADAYYANRDPYQEVADKAGCSREQGKRGWLAIQYGAGNYKIAKLFGWPFRARATWPDAPACRDPACWDEYNAQLSVRFRREFFALCPGIKAGMARCQQQAEQTRALRLWTGRVVHFDGEKSRPFAAWNRLIQGSVAEMLRVAMQRAEAPLREIGATELLQVHDELVVEVPEEAVMEAARITREVMCDFPQFWLRPRVETRIGRNYHQLVEFKGGTSDAAANVTLRTGTSA